jgi:hypothetical protein
MRGRGPPFGRRGGGAVGVRGAGCATWHGRQRNLRGARPTPWQRTLQHQQAACQRFKTCKVCRKARPDGAQQEGLAGEPAEAERAPDFVQQIIAAMR